uniref:EOG090X07E6 n=1 Tax=Evadne anonyx TaxID=141404 RepID=A0A9N6WSZ1_9CRUS|nr:EOG090X07E6 [Evadne anonyx]
MTLNWIVLIFSKIPADLNPMDPPSRWRPIKIRKQNSLSFHLKAFLHFVSGFAHSLSFRVLTKCIGKKMYCYLFSLYESYTCTAIGRLSTVSEDSEHTLDIIFQTMVFYLGLDDLLNLKNVERTKKDLKLCYPLIDKILDSLNPQEDWDNFCDITNCSDVLSCPERLTLKTTLNSFTESVGTVFGCLRIHQKTAVATANWWTLDSAELLQIQLLCSNNSNDTGIDIPIYLPVRSPKTAFRLVCWKLTQHSDICLLCGPTPSLSELERETKRFWRTVFTALKSAEACYPANIPPEITLDPSLLSYLLINYEERRALSSLTPQSGDVPTHLTAVRKRDILRTFYKTVVGNMISLPGDSKEVFMNFEYYVCHAWKKEPYLMLILYPTGLHNHFMRSITRDALRLLSCDKNCKW